MVDVMGIKYQEHISSIRTKIALSNWILNNWIKQNQRTNRKQKELGKTEQID
jgi:hypothetical protein